MADEITITAGMKLNNGILTSREPNKTRRFDQTTARYSSQVKDVGIIEEAITFGDTVPGYVMLENLDDTNFVDYGNSTGDLGFSIEANSGMALLKINTGATLYVKADTAICKIRVTAFNS